MSTCLHRCLHVSWFDFEQCLDVEQCLGLGNVQSCQVLEGAVDLTPRACVTPVRPGEEPTKHFCPPSNHFVSTFLRQKTRNRWSEPKESSKLDIKISVCCTERVKSFMDNAQIDSRAIFRKASSGSVRVTIKTEDGSLCLTGWEPQYWGLQNTSCQQRIWLCWSVAAACSKITILISKRQISRTTIGDSEGLSLFDRLGGRHTPGF